MLTCGVLNLTETFGFDVAQQVFIKQNFGKLPRKKFFETSRLLNYFFVNC